MGGGQNLIFSCFLVLFSLSSNAQILTVNFDDDGCAGNGCNLLTDLIGDGCVLTDESIQAQTQILSLGGFNKITNECDIWFKHWDNSFPSLKVAGSGDRKLVFHRYANVAPYLSNTLTSMPIQRGVFFDVPKTFLKENYFYQVKFELSNILPYECSRVGENGGGQFNPYSPTVHVSSRISDETHFSHTNWSVNEQLLTSSDYLGLHTVHGFGLGVFESPTFKINFLQELLDLEDYKLELAFYLAQDDAGACDDIPNGIINNGGGDQSPLAQIYGVTLLDNIVVDCDKDNITFDLDVSLSPLTEGNCLERLYCATISTDCPAINYNEYPFELVISGNGIIPKIVSGTGQKTYFTMDDLETGNYTVSVLYNTTTGKNILVSTQGYDGRETVIVNHEQNAPYMISSNTTYTEPIYVPKSIIVKSGATLTIKDIAYFHDDASVIVEKGGHLIIDGGTLTRCSTQWQGINMSLGGDVTIINYGQITGAKYAIQSLDTDKGGHLICDYASFTQNGVAIVIAKSNVTTDFKNSTFLSSNRGFYFAHNTNTHSLTNCYISGMTYEGLAAIDTNIDIEGGNTFLNCEYAVYAGNIFGLSGPAMKIGNTDQTANLFNNNERAIYSHASSCFIKNNIIEENTFGIYIGGFNTFESELNTFKGSSYAEAIYDSGTRNLNHSNDNIYKSTEGIFTVGRNDDYTFKNNCFATTWWDFLAPINSQISIAQGDKRFAAANCFTKNGVRDFVCETLEKVVYYVPENKENIIEPPCMYPITTTANTNYALADADTYSTDGCKGAGGRLGSSEYDYFLVIACDSTKLKTKMDSLRSIVTAINNIPNPSSLQKWRKAFTQRHLYYAYNQWAACLKKANKLAQLKAWYQALAAQDGTDKHYKIKATETTVEMGQYNTARSEVNALKAADPSSNNIYDAMLLSIDYVEKIKTRLPGDNTVMDDFNMRNIVDGSYVLNSANLQLLRNVAATPNTYAAYGRALLKYLTGEVIDPNYSMPVNVRSKPNAASELVETLSFTPNPTSDFLTINIDNYNLKTQYDCQIISLMGDVVKKSKLESHNVLDVSALPSGIYILETRKDDVMWETKKIIIQR